MIDPHDFVPVKTALVVSPSAIPDGCLCGWIYEADPRFRLASLGWVHRSCPVHRLCTCVMTRGVERDRCANLTGSPDRDMCPECMSLGHGTPDQEDEI